MFAEKIIPLHGSEQSAILTATIKSVSGSLYLIANQNGIFNASLAFSCVIKPKQGDEIMYCQPNAQQAIIIAIISRPNEQSVELSFEHDVSISSKQGTININAQEQVNVAAVKSIKILSDDLNVVSNNALFSAKNAKTMAEHVTNSITKITTLSESIETIADRLTQHLKHSIRVVQGVDQSKSGEKIMTVKRLFSLRSKQAALLTENDMKIDAKRIHMG